MTLMDGVVILQFSFIQLIINAARYCYYLIAIVTVSVVCARYVIYTMYSQTCEWCACMRAYV